MAQDNGKLKKGIYKVCKYERFPIPVYSRFQRKKDNEDKTKEVSPYNTTFKELPF